MLTLPNDKKHLERIVASLHKLKQNADFQILVEFLQEELQKTDKKLRRPNDNYLMIAGHAQALERILELVDDSSGLLMKLRQPD